MPIKYTFAIKKGNHILTGKSYASIMIRERNINLRGGTRGTIDEQGKFIKENRERGGRK